MSIRGFAYVGLIGLVVAGCGGGGGNTSPTPTTPPAPSLALVAGALGGAGSADGPTASARFYIPDGIAQDALGNVYVADSANHTIRRISPGGTVTTVAGLAGQRGFANASGPIARFDNPRALAADGAGTLYVADTNNNAVRRITATGEVSTLSLGILALGLAIDTDGSVLASEGHTIVRITTQGAKSLVAGVPGEGRTVDGPRGVARLDSPTGLEVDALGNVYFTGFDQTVRRLSPAGEVTTLAGMPRQLGSADGVGAAARFRNPWGIARDATGNLYVVGDYSLRKVSPAGEVTTLAGLPGAPGSVDGSGSLARFYLPWDVIVDRSGDLLVTDGVNNTVRRVSGAGVVTTFAGSPPATTDRFALDIAVASDGTLYAIAPFRNAITRVAPDGTLTTLAGVAGSPGHADGMGSAARFNTLNGIAVDAAGMVYVSDVFSPGFPAAAPKIPPPAYFGTIRRITPAGEVTTIAGSASTGGNVDGVGAAARFDNVRGLAVDAAGNIYVADNHANTIRRIAPGGVVSTLAGMYSPFSSGWADGVGTAARFSLPEDVAVDAQGNVFVADTSNQVIRKITPDGTVSTIAGSASIPAQQIQHADGVGAQARFWFPRSLAADTDGNLYVADGAHTIRKISPAAVVTTVVGVPYQVGFIPGPLPGVLQYPTGLALRGTDLYIAMDTGIAVVRNRP